MSDSKRQIPSRIRQLAGLDLTRPALEEREALSEDRLTFADLESELGQAFDDYRKEALARQEAMVSVEEFRRVIGGWDVQDSAAVPFGAVAGNSKAHADLVEGVPAKVKDMEKEVLKKNPSYEPGQAMPTAWSIYCRSTGDSSHCHRPSGKYLTKTRKK